MDSAYKLQWKQVVLKLALTLAAAVIVNWAILRLFGQTSADRAEHSLVGVLVLMAYVSIVVPKNGNQLRRGGFFLLALVPCYLGTVFPDLDIRLLGIGGHRNPLFHSSLSFLALRLLVGRGNVIVRTMVAGYGVGLGSHLWWDVFDYGDVRWLPGGVIDRLWLAGNGLLCFLPPRRRFRRRKGLRFRDGN